MVQKDFTAWHAIKTSLQLRVPPFFEQREIWWMSLGSNVGSEEDGKGSQFARPVLVLRKFNHEMFYGIPLSTTHRLGRYYYHLSSGDRSVALLTQVRAFDAHRLLDRVGKASEKDYYSIRQKIAELFQPPSSKMFTPAETRVGPSGTDRDVGVSS